MSLETPQPDLLAHWRRGAETWLTRRNKILVGAAALIIAVIGSVVLVTSGSSTARPRSAPTAEQAGAGRDAAAQLAPVPSLPTPTHIRFGPEQLDGLSALATRGFQPDRVDVAVRGGVLTMTYSHKLPLGRWLNLTVTSAGDSKGFPRTELTIGKLSVPAFLSRKLFELTRAVLRLRGADLPPLDRLVRSTRIGRDSFAATIDLPKTRDAVERIAGSTKENDREAVIRAYCRLTREQAADPQPSLAVQVRRAFPANMVPSATVESNRAAFIALAMFVVDPQVGDLADVTQAQIAACPNPAVPIMLRGRADLPKHWSLSAALAVGVGMKLSESMGEWKELADSVSTQSSFQPGDPTGFSFVDLSADRSGSRIAKAATNGIDPTDQARRLSDATEDRILPPALMALSDGMTNTGFIRRYGGIDDPRFTKAVAGIDAVLARQGL